MLDITFILTCDLKIKSILNYKMTANPERILKESLRHHLFLKGRGRKLRFMDLKSLLYYTVPVILYNYL